ncbi:MAG TPA: outer membrane beta-barrel protein [Steroidobacteraceae bacterium]|nr:outer membrane beta-barrel protein [Steroidobacteraceae bacterium]
MLAVAAAHAQSLAPRALFTDDRGAELFDTEGAEGGIRAGAFDVRAAAGVSYGMDSNVYALPEATAEQSVATGEALVRAVNKSSTRDILGLAFVRARRFEDARDQDSTEFGALARYDGWIGSQNRLTAGFSAEHGIESRNDIETPTTVALSPYDDLRAGFTHAHLFNRFALETRLDARRLQYDATSQQYRDRSQYRAELRGAYQLRADMSWVITGYFNRDEFDDPSPLALSAGTAGGLLGLHFDVSELLELEVGAGYFERSYDDLDEPLDGVSLRGTALWHPTRLTTVRAQVLRTDAPTHVDGAFGKVRNDARLRVTHEYSRNLVLHAGARFIADDFETIDRVDSSWLAELGASWAFGRHSVLRFAYDYGTRDHDDAMRSFDRHVASLAYIMRL